LVKKNYSCFIDYMQISYNLNFQTPTIPPSMFYRFHIFFNLLSGFTDLKYVQQVKHNLPAITIENVVIPEYKSIFS
jgi:hypothetical protein